METQTLEHTNIATAEITSSNAEVEAFFAGLEYTAQAIREKPRQRRLLEIYGNHENPDAIHTLADAPIADERARVVFWHNHGTFVAQDGGIYRVRMDDNGLAQLYVSPVDERAQSVDCIRPFTYDSHVGPYGIELRVDFINGLHRTLPYNTKEEHMLQALEGRDVMLPRHSEEMAFRPDRDSIFLHKNPDGSIDAWLHDIDGGATRLYGASEVLAMAAVQDDREMATAADYRLTA